MRNFSAGVFVLVAGLWLNGGSVRAAGPENPEVHALAGMPLRSIGPALTSGRVVDFAFHPKHPEIYYVAMASGGVWKTLNDGITWQQVFSAEGSYSVGTVMLDPANPEVVWVGSGENNSQRSVSYGDGLYRSLDGGSSWQNMGLRDSEHISMIRFHPQDSTTIAPSDADIVYAIIEANAEEHGVYRSTDFGQHWTKQSDRITTSPQYYNELVVDPENPARLYSLDTLTQVSEDGGKTWAALSVENRHVDDHALWIDPANTDHLFIGGDGGVFESWDRGQQWRHVQNLPATQFYRVTPDNDLPFYNVCGGTQDNQTFCGPSRTAYTDGITNADWWIPWFGDGFKAQIDPQDANVVYALAQHGALARFDRISGEHLAITPQPPAGVNNYKWNWNSPLIISPHNHERLYFGSERLFRSDDRGESWVAVSGDLSRRIDRNKLEVMGRVWSVDAVAKNASTSLYGSMIALDESPLVEGLLYVGTDDGLIQVSPDGGQNWTRVKRFQGVPDMSLVEDVIASRHDAKVAYAVIDNHKRGDHKPYVLRSNDRGLGWTLV